jgi:hypothetical protein
VVEFNQRKETEGQKGEGQSALSTGELLPPFRPHKKKPLGRLPSFVENIAAGVLLSFSLCLLG